MPCDALKNAKFWKGSHHNPVPTGGTAKANPPWDEETGEESRVAQVLKRGGVQRNRGPIRGQHREQYSTVLNSRSESDPSDLIPFNFWSKEKGRDSLSHRVPPPFLAYLARLPS